MMSDERRNLLRNLTAMIFVTFLQRGVGFLSIFVLSRILHPVELGMYASVQSTAQTFYGMARLGLEASLLVSVARFVFPEEKKSAERLLGEALTLFLSIAVIAAATLFLLANWIADTIFSAPELTPYIRVSAVMVAAHVALQFNFTIFAGFNASADFARITGLTALASLLPIVGGAVVYGPQGAAWVATGAIVVTVIALTIRLHHEFVIRELRVRPRLPSRITAKLLQIGFPFYIAGLLVTPVEFLCMGYLTGISGVGAMGELRVIQVISSAAMLIPGAISGPLVSHLSMKLKQSNHIEPILNQFRIIWVLSLVLSVGVAAVWPLLIDIMFGASFGQAMRVGVIAMIAFIPYMLWNVLTCGFLASHGSSLLLVAGVAQLVTMSVVAQPLISTFGIGGFLGVQATAVSMATLTGLILLGRRFKSSVWRSWMVPLFSFTMVLIFVIIGGIQWQTPLLVRACVGLLLGFSLLMFCKLWIFSDLEYTEIINEFKAIERRVRSRFLKRRNIV